MADLKKEKSYFANLPNPQYVEIQNSDGAAAIATAGAAYKTLVTAPADGCIVDSILISSTDTVARTVFFAIVEGGVAKHIQAIAVPIASGTDGVNQLVDACNNTAFPCSNQNKRYIRLKSGQTLVVGSSVAVTATKKIMVHAQVLEFEAGNA